MNTFFISDQHFHHKNVLDFENRPFETVEEMNQGLIEAHNSVVRKTDTVYMLGDFSFGSPNQWLDVLNQLRGNIILIQGNHDKTKTINRVVRDGYIQEFHPLGTRLKVEKFLLNLCHYPVLIGERPLNFNIHGHIHSQDMDTLGHINVGVDSSFMKSFSKPFGTPVELEKIMNYIKEVNPVLEERYVRGS